MQDKNNITLYFNNDFFSNSTDETLSIAYNFSKFITTPNTLILKGNLGAGKTQFVKGFIKGYISKNNNKFINNNPLTDNNSFNYKDNKNIKSEEIENEIVSPTFTILNQYSIDNTIINHFDLYRINDFEELYFIGIEDFLKDQNAINLFEWGYEYIEDFKEYTNNIILVSFEIINNSKRKITFSKI